jgi:two-component system sporulation sensor kinase A
VDLQRAEEHADDPSKARALVGRALRNVQQLDLVVSGSLNVARQRRTSFRPIDLCPVLNAAVAAAEPAFARSGGTISWAAPGPLYVDGDAVALRHVFTNVLINAGQSLHDGGKAAIEAEANGGGCVVTIRDTGIGIAPERLAQIGEPFHSTKADGTGIGLTIARRILAGHRAELAIDSQLGVGTVVRITFPPILPIEAVPDANRREATVA